jgi:hypothetical protein
MARQGDEFVVFGEGAGYGGRFHEIGAGADDVDDVHFDLDADERGSPGKIEPRIRLRPFDKAQDFRRR